MDTEELMVDWKEIRVCFCSALPEQPLQNRLSKNWRDRKLSSSLEEALRIQQCRPDIPAGERRDLDSVTPGNAEPG
jgi:hypothetical protein